MKLRIDTSSLTFTKTEFKALLHEAMIIDDKIEAIAQPRANIAELIVLEAVADHFDKWMCINPSTLKDLGMVMARLTEQQKNFKHTCLALSAQGAPPKTSIGDRVNNMEAKSYTLTVATDPVHAWVTKVVHEIFVPEVKLFMNVEEVFMLDAQEDVAGRLENATDHITDIMIPTHIVQTAMTLAISKDEYRREHKAFLKHMFGGDHGQEKDG
jgi:hypothetical protein